MTVNMVGKQCGRLLVIKREGNDSRGEITWRAQCKCGNETVVLGSNLRTGNTQSCGCLHSEKAKVVAYNMSQGNITHGMTGTSVYHSWEDMKGRCNSKHPDTYPYYAGRGITYCLAWAKFEPFYEWAMANGFKDGLELDRRDNDKGYSPNNCRWVTHSGNMRNTRANNKIKIFGEVKTVIEWCEDDRCVVSERAFRGRLERGWPVRLALISPYKSYKAA